MKFTQQQKQLLKQLYFEKELMINKTNDMEKDFVETLKQCNIEFSYKNNQIKIDDEQLIYNFLTKELHISDYFKIILYLSKSNNYFKMQDIADNLFVSKSQIQKILSQTDSVLTISKVKNKGNKLVSLKIDVKFYIVKMLLQTIDIFDFEVQIHMFFKQYYNINITLQQFEEVNELISNNFKNINTNTQLEIIIMYLLDQTLGFDELTINEEIKQIFNYYADEGSTLYWLSYKTNSKISKNSYVEIFTQINELLQKELGLEITSEEKYLKMMFNHIMNLTTKKYNIIPISDKLVEDFKLSYPISYQAGEIISSYISQKYDVALTQVDILHLGMYYQILEKKHNEKLNFSVTIVTDKINVLAVYLKNILDKNTSITTITSYSLADYLKERKVVSADLIVSNIKDLNNLVDKPFYYVDTINESKIQNDTRLIITKILITNLLNSGLDENYLYLNLTVDSYEEALNKIGDSLIKQNIIKEEYLQSVKNREKLNDQVLHSKISIPHGNSYYVCKNKIVIANLVKPVKLKNGEVNQIIWIMTTSDTRLEYSESLAIVYRQIFKMDLYNNCKRAQNKEALRNEFTKYMLDI